MCLQLNVRRVILMRTHMSTARIDVASVAFGIAAAAGVSACFSRRSILRPAACPRCLLIVRDEMGWAPESVIALTNQSPEDRGQGGRHVVMVSDHPASSVADGPQITPEVQIVFA